MSSDEPWGRPPSSIARYDLRRRVQSDDKGIAVGRQKNFQRMPQQNIPDTYDNLDESRVGVNTSMSSWESSFHNFESNPDEPSSQQIHHFHYQQQQQQPQQHLRPSSSLPDRRKFFDTTTPTLVDEEDDEEMILTLERSHAVILKEESELKYSAASELILVAPSIPGITSNISGIMDSTNATPTTFAEQNETEVSALRRTPGAMAMQRSNSSGVDKLRRKESEGSYDHAFTQSEHQPRHPIRPPWSSAWSKEKERCWSKEKERDCTGLSPRPFSPGLQRLTEDIGNLLQDDEENEVDVEIPIAFREDIVNFEVDRNVLGSFSVDRNSTFSRKTIPRPSAVGSSQREKQCRGSSVKNNNRGAIASANSGFFLNAQHPKPRRNGNEHFEFARTTEDNVQPHQLLNFGGAFSRPVQTSMFTPVSQQPPCTLRMDFPGMRTETQLHPLFSAQSFDSGNTVSSSPNDHLFSPYTHTLQSPSPVSHTSTTYRKSISHQSDNLVNAPLFVPMAVHRASPSPSSALLPSQQQQHLWLQAPILSNCVPSQEHLQAHDCNLLTSQNQQSLHSIKTTSYPYSSFGESNNGYMVQVQSMQSPTIGEARFAMTPSPHLTATPWQQQQQQEQQQQQSRETVYLPHEMSSGAYVVLAPSKGTEIVGSLLSSRKFSGDTDEPLMTSFASTASCSALSPVFISEEASCQPKKDIRRGKRGKRKGIQRKTESAESSSCTSIVEGVATNIVVSFADKNDQVASTCVESIFSQKNTEALPGSISNGDQEGLGTSSDDILYAKRAELDENSATRLAFKNFYKTYRLEERLGLQKAKAFASKALTDNFLPASIHWRVYIELADIARRSNRFVEARSFYQKICQIQPYASQGWIEYSKLEEECGNMHRVTNILHAGLEYCECNENLLIRTIKHHERMGNLDHSRSILARLKHVGIDKVWRTILEGATFEARAGNIALSRRVLKYIMHHVPWYGPLYVEFYQLQRDYGGPVEAMAVVERGLLQIPRYGPLWFAAIRVCEELDFEEKDYHLPRTTAMLHRALSNVSKEIAWKVHLEAAFIFERAANEQSFTKSVALNKLLETARHFYCLTLGTCRLNLRWKVWLAAGRMELYAGNTAAAQAIFSRAHEVAPEKVRSLTFLDFARLHEFNEEIELARALLLKGRYFYGHDWKVWLENVLLETRDYRHMIAFEIARRALEIHPGTGRLWSIFVQLSHYIGGDGAQYLALRDALNAVPKSGEVWCEGARIHLNPFSDLFDLDRARRHLYFAEKFTPQYGDTFLETVRLELIDQWLHPISETIWDLTKRSFITACKSSKSLDCVTKYIIDVALAVSCARETTIEKSEIFSTLEYKTIIPFLQSSLFMDDVLASLDFSTVVMACSNADPNYGTLWFNCRKVQTDHPRRVVERAALIMVEEILSQAHVYLAALVRRRALLLMITDNAVRGDMDLQVADNDKNASFDVINPDLMSWEDIVDYHLRNSPSLRDILNPMDPTTGSVLLQSTISGSNFLTGLMDYSRRHSKDRMSISDRKHVIFATDALFP